MVVADVARLVRGKESSVFSSESSRRIIVESNNESTDATGIAHSLFNIWGNPNIPILGVSLS